jgi:hypothetical protein
VHMQTTICFQNSSLEKCWGGFWTLRRYRRRKKGCVPLGGNDLSGRFYVGRNYSVIG